MPKDGPTLEQQVNDIARTLLKPGCICAHSPKDHSQAGCQVGLKIGNRQPLGPCCSCKWDGTLFGGAAVGVGVLSDVRAEVAAGAAGARRASLEQAILAEAASRGVPLRQWELAQAVRERENALRMEAPSPASPPPTPGGQGEAEWRAVADDWRDRRSRGLNGVNLWELLRDIDRKAREEATADIARTIRDECDKQMVADADHWARKTRELLVKHDAAVHQARVDALRWCAERCASAKMCLDEADRLEREQSNPTEQEDRPICDTPGCGRPIPVGGEGDPEICPVCLACLKFHGERVRVGPRHPSPAVPASSAGQGAEQPEHLRSDVVHAAEYGGPLPAEAKRAPEIPEETWVGWEGTVLDDDWTLSAYTCDRPGYKRAKFVCLDVVERRVAAAVADVTNGIGYSRALSELGGQTNEALEAAARRVVAERDAAVAKAKELESETKQRAELLREASEYRVANLMRAEPADRELAEAKAKLDRTEDARDRAQEAYNKASERLDFLYAVVTGKVKP